MYFKHWQRLKMLDLVSSTPNQAFFAYQILYFTDSNVTTIKQWLQRPASLLIHFEVYFFQTFLADVFITLWGLSYQWRWAQCLHSLCGITICQYSFYIIFLKMVILLTGYYLHFEHRRQFLQNTGLGLGFGGRAGGLEDVLHLAGIISLESESSLSYLASATVALTIAHTATKTAGTPEIRHNAKWDVLQVMSYVLFTWFISQTALHIVCRCTSAALIHGESQSSTFSLSCQA